MKTYNMNLVNCDTDSISFCNQDSSPISPEQQRLLIDEINSYFPEEIKYAHDGYYTRVVIFKAKNYILYDVTKEPENQVTIKGSALKATTKSPALQEFLKGIFNVLIHTKGIAGIGQELNVLYERYVTEIMTMPDIKRWAVRKTLSSTMIKSKRTNETKVMDALVGSAYVEGDRFYTYYRSDDSISLVENFDGNYNRKRLLENLFDTIKICDTILPVKELIINYSLVKHFKQLEAKYEGNS